VPPPNARRQRKPPPANASVSRSFALIQIGRNGAGGGEKPLADPPVVPSMSDVHATLRFELEGRLPTQNSEGPFVFIGQALHCGPGGVLGSHVIAGGTERAEHPERTGMFGRSSRAVARRVRGGSRDGLVIG
jgi:hypothetical protein